VAGGTEVVIVHGGAPDIAALADQLGVRPRTLRSPSGVTSRHTDARMLDVVTLALTGRAKPRLLRALAAYGIRATGVTGLDGGLLKAERKRAWRAVENGRTFVVRDDLSGRITKVEPALPRALLDAGFVPVVSPPAAGADGGPLNVDADRAAAAVAAAMGADRLILLTAAPGVLRDAADPASVLPRCALPRAGPVPYAATGGMHRKLIAAREALLCGVPDVVVGDGRVERPVSAALGGRGTRVEMM
jgi:[amino group carrier protein]-L-2-aminoadipate 6-kinase